MSLLSLILYLPLQILFIPLAIPGVALVGYRQLAISRKLGISQTAIEVLNGRWTMHIFGLRQDEACDRLAKRLPNTSTFGFWLMLGETHFLGSAGSKGPFAVVAELQH